MSMIDSFLHLIQKSISDRNASKLLEFIVLNFDSIPADRRGSFQNLHQELNNQYPVSKSDSALSDRVKKSLTRNVLGGCHSGFSELIVIYFRYVRDFPGDSPLVKAKKIEKLTRQCISTLRDDQPGPLFIPLVLQLTSTLRQVAINLDRDPTLSHSLSEDSNVSFVENTGNILREAFNKCIQRSKPTQPPSPTRLDSGLYRVLNSCISLYLRAQKLRNAEFLLATLEKASPPLSHYPASQRVTYLYYLGRFHFGANHFYRATKALQSAYDQCPKHTAFERQRRRILTYLIASSMCIGRFPSKILLLDPAGHKISKPFLEICKVVKAGDVGKFLTITDHTRGNGNALWLLRRGILLELRNRCEVICWRNLIFKCMRIAGMKPDTGRGVPFLRFNVVMAAARMSFETQRAREFLSGGLDGEYVDPDYEEEDEEQDGVSQQSSSPFGQQQQSFGFGQHQNRGFGRQNGSGNGGMVNGDGISNQHNASIVLQDPSDEEINSIFLSLISQKFLKGYIAYDSEDLLKSRFAILGAKNANDKEPWRAGFPNIWDVVRMKEEELDDDVPGWITVEKRRAQENSAGGGFVVNLSGARPVGMA